MAIRQFGSRFLTYGMLMITAIVTAAPFLLILNTSLRQTADVIADGPLALPRVLEWNNYMQIWKVGNFPIYFQNSAVVTIAVTMGVVSISILAAYAFVFMKFRGKELLFLFIILGLIVPTELIIIPLFYNLKDVGLLNTLWSLILPQIALGMPFSVFMLRGFMRDIPATLLESARIDGATEWDNLVYIILPVAMPAVVAVTIFSVMGSWNNYMLPTILIQDDNLRTIPVGLDYFRSKFTMDFSMVATSAVISALPTLLAYALFQRRIESGLTMGALKE
jgi:ABC-type glycerol-3-phosphate transport system permease component